MKSIGEISIATPNGRDFGDSRRAEGGNSAAVGASSLWPEGEAGPTALRSRTPFFRPRCGPRPSSPANLDETESDIG